MPSRLAAVALLLTALLLPVSLLAFGETVAAVTPLARPFTFSQDTFDFANETVWNYVNGSVQTDSPSTAATKRDYTRRCFVVSRAAVQFWKFARFDPATAPLSRDKLAEHIRDVAARSVWLPALAEDQRIVFPGFADLRALSKADPTVFQANIGLGWPIYFRVGNMPMVNPVYREGQTKLDEDLQANLQDGQPTIVWLYNFPSLSINHVVVVFGARQDAGHVVYTVYDPNYRDGPKKLDYDAGTRTFSYQPTFYFKGGTVNARAIYRGVFE